MDLTTLESTLPKIRGGGGGAPPWWYRPGGSLTEQTGGIPDTVRIPRAETEQTTDATLKGWRYSGKREIPALRSG